ncbi:DUF2721 domain-containing protein [Aliiglaciecola lipolytica]|uniref:DUF2721 domain-containing protein n=1 Tax=Aliiglaciecola lipolytica E3 TaxID=1127673 RepID=K6Y3H5_9ALTE|nr:DUF2721 domain-containing protein [Aliiglaciecola lipolytica]GAC12792.1 hypothetical protein GLIP_0137 [Aliiglaciecola lipolytica E3]
MEIHLDESAVELIQLSLAPVFLIVGMGQMLNVVTGRLARIIDRARYWERIGEIDVSKINDRAKGELKSLRRRMRFANWAVTFITAAAVTVCLDVILLLLNGLITVNLDVTIITMFIFGLLLITGGLISFFLEVSIANASLKIAAYDEM